MDNFKKVTKNLRVMARSQPLHKYALVLGLKSLKNVRTDLSEDFNGRNDQYLKDNLKDLKKIQQNVSTPHFIKSTVV